jgi:hypothetical protein
LGDARNAHSAGSQINFQQYKKAKVGNQFLTFAFLLSTFYFLNARAVAFLILLARTAKTVVVKTEIFQSSGFPIFAAFDFILEFEKHLAVKISLAATFAHFDFDIFDQDGFAFVENSLVNQLRFRLTTAVFAKYMFIHKL